jgi:regulator of protease activity HflC (stomatin/prohibitin superfamily)
MFWIIAFVIFLIPLVALFCSSYSPVVVVDHQHVGHVERLGRFYRKLDPGLHFLIPLVEKLKAVSWRFRNAEPGSLQAFSGTLIPTTQYRYDPEPLQCTTKDRFAIGVDVVTSFVVFDTLKAIYGPDIFAEIEDRVQSVIYEIARSFTIEEVDLLKFSATVNLDKINRDLVNIGVSVLSMKIQGLHMPQALVDASVRISTERMAREEELRKIDLTNKQKSATHSSALEEQKCRQQLALDALKHESEFKLSEANAKMEVERLAAETQRIVEESRLQTETKTADHVYQTEVRNAEHRLRDRRAHLDLTTEMKKQAFAHLADYPSLLPLEIARVQSEGWSKLASGGGTRLVVVAPPELVEAAGKIPMMQMLSK